jgi:hypothetical protein
MFSSFSSLIRSLLSWSLFLLGLAHLLDSNLIQTQLPSLHSMISTNESPAAPPLPELNLWNSVDPFGLLATLYGLEGAALAPILLCFTESTLLPLHSKLKLLSATTN